MPELKRVNLCQTCGKKLTKLSDFYGICFNKACEDFSIQKMQPEADHEQ